MYVWWRDYMKWLHSTSCKNCRLINMCFCFFAASFFFCSFSVNAVLCRFCCFLSHAFSDAYCINLFACKKLFLFFENVHCFCIPHKATIKRSFTLTAQWSINDINSVVRTPSLWSLLLLYEVNRQILIINQRRRVFLMLTVLENWISK